MILFNFIDPRCCCLVVFGLGAVGLAVIQGAKERKAGRIFAIDVNSSKFEVARR